MGWASPLWWDPEEVKGSPSDDFRDFLGTTLGDAPFRAGGAVENRSSPASSFTPFCCEGSDFFSAAVDPPEKRLPPPRGSEVGGEPKRSEVTEGADLNCFRPAFLAAGCCWFCFAAVDFGTAADVEAVEEEKRSSTCGFLLFGFFPDVDPDENRSSSDSSSSKRPPNFSFGFDGVVFFFS